MNARMAEIILTNVNITLFPLLEFIGGDGEDRTLDLLNAIQALSQLSYAPILK